MHPMMEHAMVSVATGVLRPLLGKLAALVEEEYAQLKSVRKEIISLQEELRSMNAVLQKLAVEDDPDVLKKEWQNQIRDLFYDVEDCVDDFLHRVEHDDGNKRPDVGFFRKNFSKLKTLGARHGIADKIRQLKVRVDDVSKRRSRYIYEGASYSARTASAVVAIDPRLPALSRMEGNLVGIDGPREEITKLLADEGEIGKKLKVVSIVGFGGLGKTTLACEVRRELRGQFDCQVTVPVSQSPDIIKILTMILSEVKGPSQHRICNVSELIEELKSYLLHKRYFIIIDDIWDPLVWEFISCAFPDNNKGSRVITTTRDWSVAATCCNYRHEYVYKMKPLDEEASRRLFFNRIFDSEGACPGELKEVSSQILRKCGGMPLAIIVISSLLASQANKVKEDWEYVGTDRLEVMRQILNLSYKNLPPHLKTCFLYLGAYPGDSVVWRDDLVRQWVAEGFLEAIGVAGSCFKELVNRSMIQPVTTDYNGDILSCRVHDMMLDLIIRKYSAEENFLTVVENNSQGIRIRGSTHNIRRLFHHSDAAGRHRTLPMPAVGIDTSKVRTFSTWGGSSPGHVPPVSKFKFIRVLILEFIPSTPGEEEDQAIDLTAMCKLFQLRYIKIRSEVRLELPTQIRALQHLETLEVSGARPVFQSGIDLPSDVAQLPCLSVLSILPHMTSLPHGIGAMKCLRSLASFVLEENSLDTITGLRHLSNLKDLYVRLPLDSCFAEAEEARVDVLCSSLPEHGDCRFYLTAWSRWAWFPGVPQWIGRLQKLYSLELGVGELSRDGVAVLAGLPALVRLDLSIRGAPRESTVITATGFPALKHLIVTCRALCLTFEAGAMPSLQKLNLEFNADGATAEQGGWCGNALAGVEHLSGLKEVYASIGGLGALAATEDSGRTAAVSALRDAIGLHPNRPRVDIMCTQGRYGLR
ncbi:hypothetical protein GQ55_1G233200 [Panicum hallii var. hallii]|uniref:Uncharacterized protein n=1 Tax=Panicum hallii var. hallii TaxID=1504633 RepID=A0A2T7F6S0_9POAL|nr:hypothetical protein GQ55_1G233200 [Panicum hallii var. hallii]